VVENNVGTLTIKGSRLRNNPSGEFFTVGYPHLLPQRRNPIVTGFTVN
jgi:hypothetical protein